MKNDIQTKMNVEMVAERVQLLFDFCAALIPYEMLSETLQVANTRASFAVDATPILEAYGREWEVDRFHAELTAKRAKALYQLINVLDTTERERLEFAEKQAAREERRKQIEQLLGL
jgi:hypothetical protein